jgi:pimeloyl-ACP methyl ester carboxylesterase
VADRIPGARIKEIQGGGHIAWGERPDEVNASIRDFLVDAEVSQPYGADEKRAPTI